MCMCGRQRRRKRRRRKSKLKGSMSFTDQEKKLLDVSITTTERPSGAESVEALGPEMELVESGSVPMELCEPVRITIESRANEPLTVFPPPPEFSSVLPAGAFGNIFISVSVSQEPDAVVRFPDLLDIPRARASVGSGPDGPYIPTQTFATLPRRPKSLARPVYDNMGPRVTAGGSSTLSLPDADDLPPAPPPPLCAPLDYVSLWSSLIPFSTDLHLRTFFQFILHLFSVNVPHSFCNYSNFYHDSCFQIFSMNFLFMGFGIIRGSF